MKNQEEEKKKLDIENSDNRKESQKSLNDNNKSSENISINNENQSQSSYQNNQVFPPNQNANQFATNPLTNFPAKEYFNFSFFKRQMSSRSSDIDFCQDNKEGITEFFNSKCKSIISKDSEKQNNSNKGSELNSFEYTLPKDDNNQIFLTRANSARTKNYRNSNNYIPKAVFFQRNNSNNPSCFYKKHHIGKNNIKNGNEENNGNMILKYYGNNNEFNNFNKNILEMVNDKDDEAEEDDEDNSEEDEEEDDCILTKKDKESFSVNYLSGDKGINLPKTTFSLFHRGSNNLKLEKEKEKLNNKEDTHNKIENENNENNKSDIKIIFGDFMKKESFEEKDESKDNDNIMDKEKEKENENQELKEEKEGNILEINKSNSNKDKNEIIGKYILDNNNKDKIISNQIHNQYILNPENNNKIINKEKNINMIKTTEENNFNNAIKNTNMYPPIIYPMVNNEIQLIKNINDINNYGYYNNINIKNIVPYTLQRETDEFLKNVSSYIKDQQGCRYIQKKIGENPEISNNLFDILYNDIIIMSKDLFGNYVIQKILENIKPNYLIKFIELISKDFYNLAISIYGTRVVQKALEIVSKKTYTSDKEIYDQCFKNLNKYITENIVSLSSNNNSSHIIIKYLNEIKYPQNEQLYTEVYNYFIPLCKNKHGCCVIQKCIELGNIDQKNKLLELSNLNCDNLISDQFGNYVIQYVLNLNVKSINAKVFEILNKNLIPLCKEKYASNVIEKFLINKSQESIDIINILLKNENYLHELIIDPFGNYIIQRILLLIEGESRSHLIHYIVNWYPEIKALSFGPRLISKLHERFQEFTVLVTQKYGWETTQEISYIFNKNNFKNNNYVQNNNNSGIGNMQFIRNSNMLNNFGNRMNGANNNNNFMNFQNKNNVGNINFIQMNNYMLTNGQNCLRFPMNTFGGFNNLNNINNGQFYANFANVNNLNNNMNSKPNINIPVNNDINSNIMQRLNLLGINNNPNFTNNFLNNSQNMVNYNQYLNANFTNMQNK